MKRRMTITFLGLAASALVATFVAADDRATQPNVDRLLIQAQRICPVTGKDLWSMGGTVKAEVGGATVFLCCKGCFGKRLNQNHWSQVQAKIAAAQGMCPIFKKPLGDRPVPVLVNHRLLYVCCKPCTKKVQADPSGSVAFVNEQLARRFAEPRR